LIYSHPLRGPAGMGVGGVSGTVLISHTYFKSGMDVYDTHGCWYTKRKYVSDC